MVVSLAFLKEFEYFEVGEACLCRHCVASLLLCICSHKPLVLFPVWGSAAECHLQLLERQVYSVARLCSDETFLLLCH